MPSVRPDAPALNVLFVTVDQWRGECLSSLDHVVQTPNLDRLCAGGVHFANHWAQAAPCGPSRASLYTGMYLMNHRSVLNGTPLDARHTNIALEGRALGYAPVLFGYTDTSVDPRTVPATDPRLSTYEGVLPGFDAPGHLPEGDPRLWLDHLADVGYELGADWRAVVDHPVADYAGVEEWGVHRAPTRYAAEHSQTAFLTDLLLEHLGAHSGGRWFAHVSYLRPHPPFFAPEPYNTMYDPVSVPAPVRAERPELDGRQHPLFARMVEHPLLAAPGDDQHLRQLRATYYGMMSEVDHHLGRIFDWLEQVGEWQRTMVVLTSDHGEQLGDHWILHKLGWFDASYHVPLIVRDPRPEYDTSRGRVVHAFSENVDVLPTILEQLGGDIPLQCDGHSLTAWLRGDTPEPWRNEVFFEFDFREPASDLMERAFGVSMDDCCLAVIRDARGKYVHFGGHPNLPPIFFDLEVDPDQLDNRAADPACAAKVLDYAQRMLAWRLRNAERTLTGTKLTGQGPIIRRSRPA
jgi:arylsulfatase A-like enzyme